MHPCNNWRRLSGDQEEGLIEVSRMKFLMPWLNSHQSLKQNHCNSQVKSRCTLGKALPTFCLAAHTVFCSYLRGAGVIPSVTGNHNALWEHYLKMEPRPVQTALTEDKRLSVGQSTYNLNKQDTKEVRKLISFINIVKFILTEEDRKPVTCVWMHTQPSSGCVLMSPGCVNPQRMS